MKEYKAFYVLSHPGQAEKVMEIELNKLAKEGWTLHSYAQPDLGHISAICERDISCDISCDISHLKTITTYK